MFWNAPFCMCAIRRVNEVHSKLQLNRFWSAFGLGIQKLQKTCFDVIRRHRFAKISRRAQKLPLDDPRRMAFYGRFNDKGVRQLLLGFAHPLVPLQSEEFRVALQRPVFL